MADDGPKRALPGDDFRKDIALGWPSGTVVVYARGYLKALRSMPESTEGRDVAIESVRGFLSEHEVHDD